MRHALSRLLVVALSVVAADCAVAQDSSRGRNHYKWYDVAGALHYTDALPPEAAKLGYEIVSPQGVVLKHVDRARTADEIAVAKAAQARDQAARDLVDKRERADSQLLASYPAETDLKRAQQQQLDMLEQQVNAAEISLRNQEQTLADVLARAADAERGGKTLPEAQAQQLAAMRKQVDDQRLAVEHKQAERTQAGERFEQDTLRYRTLRAKADQPSQ
jgi:hypothetical protein